MNRGAALLKASLWRRLSAELLAAYGLLLLSASSAAQHTPILGVPESLQKALLLFEDGRSHMLGAGPQSVLSEQIFIILNPIWFRWPVLSACAAGIGASLFAFLRLRRKRLKRAQKELPDLAGWRMEAFSQQIRELRGKLLDRRFAVGHLLARGGFTSILAGKDTYYGNRPCAIKVFRHELLGNACMEKCFQQVIEALERIDHPNVVEIYGKGKLAGGAFYLVMEFVEGDTLRERLNAGRLSLKRISECLRQAGAALRAIHAQHTCHRDLKPENIMIRCNAEPGCDLVLIDFSIAIVKDPDETMRGLSRAAGTLSYMAPEQAIGYADSSTDIYSLAKILIEMLTGKRLSALLPGAAMDLPERTRDLLTKSDLSLSESSIDLISQALQFDPERRPKDAYAFATAIADDIESVEVEIHGAC